MSSDEKTMITGFIGGLQRAVNINMAKDINNLHQQDYNAILSACSYTMRCLKDTDNSNVLVEKMKKERDASCRLVHDVIFGKFHTKKIDTFNVLLAFVNKTVGEQL